MLRADLHRQLRNRWNLGHRWRRWHLQSHVVAGFVGVVGVVGFFAADDDVGVGDVDAEAAAGAVGWRILLAFSLKWHLYVLLFDQI